MKKIARKISLLTASLIVSTVSMAGGIKFEHLDYEEALTKAGHEGKSVFIDVYASWCGPCKYMSRDVFTESSVGEFFNKNFISIKIDGETEEGNALMLEYGMDAYPTMIFLSANGQELKRIVGAVEAEELLKNGNIALNPETDPVFKARETFEASNKTQEDHNALISVLLSEGHASLEDECIAYFKKFQDLNLENEPEFVVFYFTVNDVDHPLMEEFIQKSSEQDPDLFTDKMVAVLENALEEAQEKEDITILENAAKKMYPALSEIIDGLGTEEEFLNELRVLY